MKKRIAVVCEDTTYTELLLRYIRKKWQDVFLVVEGQGLADIVITDIPEESREKSCFYLSTVQSDNPAEVYRYQSAEGILQEVLFKTKEAILPEVGKKRTRCIIFYTPGGSAVQSLAAKEYTKRLSTVENTIYLCFGEYGQTEEGDLTREVADLSTLCYQIHTEGEDSITREKLIAARRRGEGFSFIGYFHNPVHVVQMREEFTLLVHKILSHGLFDSIVIDLQQLPVGFQELFACTSELYSITPGDGEAQKAYEIRRTAWQEFLGKLSCTPVDIMMKEREYHESGTI
ncbi:MAG: hypothetical protein E7280_04655 [Lachnospiraceae bacterium]|nr:hypothetical protein [Lachnospiraceae bacterium]